LAAGGRLTAEIISEQFQPQTLMDMTNMKLPTQAELDQQALQQQIQAKLRPRRSSNSRWLSRQHSSSLRRASRPCRKGQCQRVRCENLQMIWHNQRHRRRDEGCLSLRSAAMGCTVELCYWKQGAMPP
jgi:hypothetical protein